MNDQKRGMGTVMTKRTGGVVLGIAAAATLLAGCNKDKTPSGQVVATVNGADITRRDLASELNAANLPRGTDVAAVQPAVMSELVSRKLIVDQARREGIDKTPDYMAASQRAQDVLLAQAMVAKWVGQPEKPDAATLDRFIADNPQRFGERRVFLLDQIQTDAKGIDPKALGPINTMDGVIEYLRSKNHPFQRGRSTLDTAGLDPAAAKEITGLAPGMPFVTTRPGGLVISVITATQPQPVPADRQREIAAQLVRQQNVQKLVADKLKSLKAGAEIEYQKGFAPPADPKPAAR